MGAPNESYQHDVASTLLHDLGDDLVEEATTNLLRRGVLSKRVKDRDQPTHKRPIKISEAYVFGPISSLLKC
jgi:oxalate---CoA ligase